MSQATLIIIDIGKNTTELQEKSFKSFFDNAIECTKRIIERKIMSQGKDLIGVILLGSKKTKNNMAEQCPGAFKHIELLIDVELPSWKMIRDLPTTPTNTKGDWFDAIIVAVDYFKNCFCGGKIRNNRILLMTNFESESSIDDTSFDQVLMGLKKEDFQVDVIGLDIYSEQCENNDIHFIKEIVDGTNGVTAPFDDTMRYLVFHRKRRVNAIPWNVDLCIGPNIKIPVSSYVRIKDEPITKLWLKSILDPITGSSSCIEGVAINRIHLHSENRNVVNSEDLIQGFSYGQEIIPFPDLKHVYNSGPKSLIVYGFTESTKVQWQNLNGSGLSYIFGRKGDKKAQNAINCLVECLQELNLVAIVRRVYNHGNAPKMYALMPVIDTNDFVCLSMVGICFAEEIKYMAFPRTELKKFACTNEQVDAFKNLIEAMDLTNAYDADEFDDKEAFPIAETINPSAQYILDCIAFRAMNPGKPLPPPRNDIMMLFKVPPLIEKGASDIVAKMKSLFVLNKVEIKHRKKIFDAQIIDNSIESKATDDKSLSDDMHKVKFSLPVKSKRPTRIGTINPISDYKLYQDLGKPLKDLALEMTNAIESLMYSNLDGHSMKALEAMKFFRTECVKGDPSHYNKWLQNFKMELYDRKKKDIIDLMKEKQLNCIEKHENSLSNFELKDEEDSQIYELDTVPNFTEMEVSSEVSNFFNDM